MFSPQNDIPRKWLSRAIQLAPFEVHKNINLIHVLNPNTHLCNYMQSLLPLEAYRIANRMLFWTNPTELYDKIDPSQLHLPRSTGMAKRHCF